MADKTAKERMEIDLEECGSLYKWWEDSFPTLWRAVEGYKTKSDREVRKLEFQLHKVAEERDAAVEELVKARRTIERIKNDLNQK